jgi:hypothetical protein
MKYRCLKELKEEREAFMVMFFGSFIFPLLAAIIIMVFMGYFITLCR